MMKLFGYLISLVVAFNTFDPGIIKDFEKAVSSLTHFGNSMQSSLGEIDNALNELRVSYDVNGSKISFNDMIKYYSLKLDKMRKDGKSGAVTGAVALLILLTVTAVVPVALMGIFVVRLISNKDKKAYIQTKLRPVLYAAGCNVFALVLFSGFFLKLTNI